MKKNKKNLKTKDNKKITSFSFLNLFVKNKKKILLALLLFLLFCTAYILVIKTFAVDTGLKSPTADAVDFGGDGNGYQTNPTNAYLNNPNYAEDTNSGLANNSSCSSAGADKHIWYNYSLDTGIPSGAIIKGIEVQQHLAVDSTTNAPFSCIQLSWDGGITWTTAQSQSLSATVKTIYTFGGPSDLWGRSSWGLSEINNTNFLVRTINGDTNNGASPRDFFLYWIPVKVYYNTPSEASITNTAQKNDGSGNVEIDITVDDLDNEDTRILVEYSDDGGANWYDPELVSATVDSGSVDLDNSNYYQIGTSDMVDTSGGSIDLAVTWDTKSGSNGNGSLDDLENSNIQIRITVNDVTDDGSPEISPSFSIDNLDPSGLANFNLSVLDYKAIDLFWDISSDTNPDKYDIWYGDNQSDVQNKSGSAQSISIGDLNTNTVIISNLNSDTVYYFKIWAFDDFGNSESVPDISGKTEKRPPPPAYTLPEQPKEEVKYSVYSVSVYEFLKGIADKIGVSVEHLIELNKDQYLDITKNNWEFKYDPSQAKSEEVEEEQKEIKEEVEKEEQEPAIKDEPIKEDIEAKQEVPQNIFMQRIYIVQPGDNLSIISQKVYGDSRRWYEIVKMNFGKYPSLAWDYNILSVGWQLNY